MIETKYRIVVLEHEPEDKIQITQGQKYLVIVGDEEGMSIRELTNDVPSAVDYCFRRLSEEGE